MSTGGQGRWARAGLAAIALLALALVLADGAERQGTGTAAGVGPTAAASELSELGPLVTVGQFNIRRGRGAEGDGTAGLWQTAACLTGVDIAGLNEVDGGGPLGLAADQASVLGGMLDLNALYAPTERRFWHPHFGNALLTDLPVRGWVRLPLPYEAGPSHRNLLYAQVGPADDPIRVVVTHIDRREDQHLQLAAALAFFLGLEPPAVLIGDLNATLANPMVAGVVSLPGVVAGNGLYPAELEGGVDWIMARGFRVVRATQCDVGASDHARIALELERLR